ncbi:MAG: hypothetical protein ABI460_16195 [Caldimonas sp.]
MTSLSRRTLLRGAGACLAFPAIAGCTDPLAGAAGIRVLRTPGDGIVPSARFGPGDLLHVVYLEDRNVQHVTSADRGKGFSAPVRVNDRPSFASGGLFRGPELALGDDGSTHVIWYSRAWELSTDRAEQGPMYARAAPGAPFLPSRNVGKEPADGLSIAMQGDQVAIVWHNGDALKLLRSDDAGRSFGAAAVLDALPCECCDTSLHLRRNGAALVVYRDRLDDHRDMFMASLEADPARGSKVRLDTESWILKGCPISGNGAAFSDDSAVVAWEHDGRILMSRVGLADLRVSAPRTLGSGRYPLVLGNADSVLVAWNEGKELVWRRYEAASLRQRDQGSVRRTTTHRAGAAVAPDGEFVLVV